MANSIIQFDINYESENPTIIGRKLHEVLGIETPYTIWFERMTEYGFSEDTDFLTKMLESSGGRPATDHELSIEMAKHICMIQRTDIGKKCRDYFLELERKWNSPEAVMARALAFSQKTLEAVKAENAHLLFQIEQKDETISKQAEAIETMAPKSAYYDAVLQNPGVVNSTRIGNDYGMSAIKFNKLLEEKHVQYKRGGNWYVYQEYVDKGWTQTKTTFIDTVKAKFSKVYPQWTQVGRLGIYELLKKDGILPKCELEEQVLMEV